MVTEQQERAVVGRIIRNGRLSRREESTQNQVQPLLDTIHDQHIVLAADQAPSCQEQGHSSPQLGMAFDRTGAQKARAFVGEGGAQRVTQQLGAQEIGVGNRPLEGGNAAHRV